VKPKALASCAPQELRRRNPASAAAMAAAGPPSRSLYRGKVTWTPPFSGQIRSRFPE
jgi:hypothetical protein